MHLQLRVIRGEEAIDVQLHCIRLIADGLAVKWPRRAIVVSCVRLRFQASSGIHTIIPLYLGSTT